MWRYMVRITKLVTRISGLKEWGIEPSLPAFCTNTGDTSWHCSNSDGQQVTRVCVRAGGCACAPARRSMLPCLCLSWWGLSTLVCAAYRIIIVMDRSCGSHSFIHSFIHSYVHSFVHSFIHTFIHSFIHTFIHSFVHSFIRSFIHSFCSLSHDRSTASSKERSPHSAI